MIIQQIVYEVSVTKYCYIGHLAQLNALSYNYEFRNGNDIYEDGRRITTANKGDNAQLQEHSAQVDLGKQLRAGPKLSSKKGLDSSSILFDLTQTSRKTKISQNRGNTYTDLNKAKQLIKKVNPHRRI